MAVSVLSVVVPLCLQVVSSVTGNNKCVGNIADANVLQYILLVLYMLPQCTLCTHAHSHTHARTHKRAHMHTHLHSHKVRICMLACL